MKVLKEQIESLPLRDALLMLPVESRKQLLMQATTMAKSPELKARIFPFTREFRANIDLSATVEKTHLKVLSAAQMEIAIQTRKERFAGLTWSLTQHPTGTLILGDVGPFAKYRNSNEYTQIIKVEGVLDAVVLPISSTHLLIGQRGGLVVDLPAELVNTISAELSRDFFVVSRKTDAEFGYVAALGNRRALYSKSEFFN